MKNLRIQYPISQQQKIKKNDGLDLERLSHNTHNRKIYYFGSAEGHEYPDLQVGDEVNPRTFFAF